MTASYEGSIQLCSRGPAIAAHSLTTASLKPHGGRLKSATPTTTHSIFFPMPDLPSNVHRDQLSALSHGIALWDPTLPEGLYDRVSIGDVGYLHPSEGTFIRLFNVMLPWDDPLNHRLGVPEAYEPLDCGPFANTIKRQFDRMDYRFRSVSADTNADSMQAMRPNE